MTIVIGVDLGIRKIAAATWYDRDDVQTLHWTGAYTSEGASRGVDLSLCANWLDNVLTDALIARLPQEELHIFIEMPLMGNNRKYSLQLAMTYGAVLARLAPLWSNVFGVNVSEWKKQVLGKGNAGKTDVVNYITDINNSYASLCGHDQDRYDAAAVGLYGVLVAARADLIATRS